MKNLPLAQGFRRRLVAGEPFVSLKNRMCERNPILSDNNMSFIKRPKMVYWTTIGEGPIRKIFQGPGTFNEDSFAVSGGELWRLDRTGGLNGGNRVIYDGLIGASVGSAVNMCVTGDIGGGSVPPRLFFCDGSGLFVYLEEGYASGTLTLSGAISDGEVIELGGVYYRMSTGSLDSGAPAGTAGNPWRVLSTGSGFAVLTRLYGAINASGTPGTDYSTALTTENPNAVAQSFTASQLRVRAVAEGAAGNTVTSTETGANMAWGAGTLTGGGTEGVIQIPTPEEVGVIDVVSLNNFVFVIPAQGFGLNGRFYWIEPAELFIDPLNFATAERSADPINAAEVFNDQLWYMGTDTTETWFMTGDADAPVQRLSGVVFDRGAVQGTAVQRKGSVILVDQNGGVYEIRNGEKKISPPDIDEILRKAIAIQNAAGI